MDVINKKLPLPVTRSNLWIQDAIEQFRTLAKKYHIAESDIRLFYDSFFMARMFGNLPVIVDPYCRISAVRLMGSGLISEPFQTQLPEEPILITRPVNVCCSMPPHCLADNILGAIFKNTFSEGNHFTWPDLYFSDGNGLRRVGVLLPKKEFFDMLDPARFNSRGINTRFDWKSFCGLFGINDPNISVNTCVADCGNVLVFISPLVNSNFMINLFDSNNDGLACKCFIERGNVVIDLPKAVVGWFRICQKIPNFSIIMPKIGSLWWGLIFNEVNSFVYINNVSRLDGGVVIITDIVSTNFCHCEEQVLSITLPSFENVVPRLGVLNQVSTCDSFKLNKNI